MEKSMAAANIDRMRVVLNKAKKKIEKIDNERVNTFKIIVSFPAIKDKIDQNCNTETPTSQTQMVNKLVRTYQLDADDAYTQTICIFSEFISSLPLVKSCSLICDIDHTGNHHFPFPFLLNIVCFILFISLLIVIWHVVVHFSITKMEFQ